MTIDFDWKSGVATKDWSNVAKKGQIDVSSYLFWRNILSTKVFADIVEHIYFLLKIGNNARYNIVRAYLRVVISLISIPSWMNISDCIVLIPNRLDLVADSLLEQIVCGGSVAGHRTPWICTGHSACQIWLFVRTNEWLLHLWWAYHSFWVLVESLRWHLHMLGSCLVPL